LAGPKRPAVVEDIEEEEVVAKKGKYSLKQL
jgi:hypothetical protein